MRALRLEAFKSDPVLVDVPQPEPGPGEVVVRVGGAGACHSDLHVMREFDEGMAPWGPPFTLGHENAGWVHAVGAGVTGVDLGLPVAVYGLLGCRHCAFCAAGAVNRCVHGASGPPGLGLGVDGGMAEYLLVPDAAHLVPLDDLDPVEAAPLTDAALTPYRAIKRVAARLTPRSHAVVIGAGGLGSFAVQILRAITPAQVIAVDTRQSALDLAAEAGAGTCVPAGDDAAAQIRDATNGSGADLVLDFVGASGTVALAAAVAAAGGDVIVVGAAAGSFTWNFYALPYEVNLTTSFWGTLPELHEVIALAQRGLITSHVQRFGLDDGLAAYRSMERGELSGRAVIVP